MSNLGDYGACGYPSLYDLVSPSFADKDHPGLEKTSAMVDFFCFPVNYWAFFELYVYGVLVFRWLDLGGLVQRPRSNTFSGTDKTQEAAVVSRTGA